jgi:segregation and condensation protein A
MAASEQDHAKPESGYSGSVAQQAAEPEPGKHFRVHDFEGPLDLLLFLIKRSEVNIYDIPIAEITEQYLAFLDYATRVDLENITEFYVMATTLLHIKSRMLLPLPDEEDDEEWEDPRQELVDRLIEYQKYKKLTELMSEQEKQAEWTLERRKKQPTLPFPDNEELWEQIDVWDLLRTFTGLMSTLSPERILDLYEEVSVNEKLSLIEEYLETKGEFLFTDLILKPDSAMDLVCAFLALLEAVKAKRIRVFQNKLFGDIRIRHATEG